MTDDIVARLRAETDGATVNPDGIEAADEIERLRAELAAEREWKRANIELAEHLVTVTAERNALRAELAVERERADAHYRVLELVSAKRDELRADLRDELERADAWHKTFLQTQKHNEELRGLLREARPYVSHHGSERTNELLARIDAALKGDGDE